MDDNPFARFAPAAMSAMPGTIVDDNPFAQFAGAVTTPNLPSSLPAGVTPPDAGPSPGDDGRSFVLRRTSTPTPDAPTWLGRRVQDIEGRQDPDYTDVPSVFSQNEDLLQAPTGTAAMLGADDDQLADVMQKQLGDRYLSTFKDANGYPLIQFRDAKTGEPKLGYVNKPGLDSEDVVRGIKGALPYAAGAEVLGPLIGSFPLFGRILTQSLVGGGTSIGGDVALQRLGSQQSIQGGKAATIATLGPLGEIGGEAFNRLWTRFVTIPKYFDSASGQLTPLGRQAAHQMGLDPDQMMSDAMSTFGKTYALDPAAAKSAVDAGTFDFNIPATKGQLAKDPEQLMQEKAMRSGLYGLPAKQQIEDLDQRQAQAIARGVSDTIPSRLAGQKWQGGQAPEVYGANIGGNLADARANAKAAEKAAWDAAPDISPLPGATDLLPPIIGKRLSDLSVFDPVNTPTAYNMGEQVQSFMQGKAPATKLDSTLGISRPQTVDALRKQLSTLRKNAQTPSDQTAAGAIYHGFNDWIDEAARQSLLSGNPQAAAALKSARDVSAEINKIFRPSQGGQLTPGGKILQTIKSADTPEQIVRALIPSPNSEIRPGTIEALNLIKRGLQRFGKQGSEQQAWNSIKMAYLSKLTHGRNGEVLSPQVMAQNIKKAKTAQASLYATIFEPGDRVVIQRFLTQLERVTWKDPNPSGTATGVAGLTRQMFGKLLDSFGGLGRAAWDFSGIQHAWGSNIARKAVQQVPEALPRATPLAAMNFSNALLSPLAIQGQDNIR